MCARNHGVITSTTSHWLCDDVDYRHGHGHRRKQYSYETIGQCLSSCGLRDPIGGVCHAMGCREQTTRLYTLSYPKSGWSTPRHTQMFHRAVDQSLQEYSLAIYMEDTTPFWPNVQAECGSSLRHKDVIVTRSKIFRGAGGERLRTSYWTSR